MKIIGLCGGSGSGKGACSKIFLELGIPSIDTDAVYHELISENSTCVEQLAATFGHTVVNECGGIDRRELGKIVFADNSRKKLELLNQITHKHILQKTRELIEEYRQNGAAYVIIDAPLLFESGFDKECDVTVAVIADKNLRVERIILRDGISRDDAIKRIDSQISDEELRECCDYVIENNLDVSSLKDEILNFIKNINLNK